MQKYLLDLTTFVIYYMDLPVVSCSTVSERIAKKCRGAKMVKPQNVGQWRWRTELHCVLFLSFFLSPS